MGLFLSHAGFSEVVGGVEVYAGELQKVFPDLERVDYHSHKDKLGDSINPLMREPVRAKLLGEYINDNYADAELVFTNGMFSWNLLHKKQVNICHGTYAAFAEATKTFFDPDFYRLKHVYSRYEKKAARKARLVVANSRQTAFNAEKRFGVKAEVVYPPVDFLSFRPLKRSVAAKRLGWNGTNILFVGRPEHAKGFDLVEALAGAHPELFFRCVLSRPWKSGLPNLSVLGGVPREQLPVFYSAADVVLAPSRFEGFGLVVAESLALNKKVVSLSTGLAAEMDSANLFTAVPELRDVESKLLEALSSEESDSRKEMEALYHFQVFRSKWLELESRL